MFDYWLNDFNQAYEMSKLVVKLKEFKGLLIAGLIVLGGCILLFVVPYPLNEESKEESKIKGMELYKKGLVKIESTKLRNNRARTRGNRPGIFEVIVQSKITNESDETITLVGGKFFFEELPLVKVAFRYYEEIPPHSTVDCWTWVDVIPKGEFIVDEIMRSGISLAEMNDVRIKNTFDPLRGI